MTPRLRLSLALCIAAAVAACSQENTPTTAASTLPDTSIQQGLSVLDREGIETHLLYLADDERLGRMTGTEQYEESAAYVAGLFADIGLEPAGDDGWYQQVPMLANRIDVESANLVYHQDVGDGAQRWKEDFVMSGDTVRPVTEVRAEVVFVGFGIHAPELGYSDYDGVDVQGKVVALFGGAPDSFPHNERAFYSSRLTKSEEAVARGAVGVLSLRSRTDQRRYSWKRISENAGVRPGMSWVNLSGAAANYFPELQGGAVLNVPAADDLFSGSPLSFEEALDAADAGTPLSTPLGVEVTLARRTEHETVTSPNAIGLLRGSDPALADEYVVYTAHLDHVGTGAAVNGDSIYNGMYDNAMGVALLIEAARAFAAMPTAPAPIHSVYRIDRRGKRASWVRLFCALSDGSVREPGRQRQFGHAAASLPAGDVIAFGSEHSSLEAVIRGVVGPEGFDLSPDRCPKRSCLFAAISIRS